MKIKANGDTKYKGMTISHEKEAGANHQIWIGKGRKGASLTYALDAGGWSSGCEGYDHEDMTKAEQATVYEVYMQAIEQGLY
jgi:hypothetical protein